MDTPLCPHCGQKLSRILVHHVGQCEYFGILRIYGEGDTYYHNETYNWSEDKICYSCYWCEKDLPDELTTWIKEIS